MTDPDAIVREVFGAAARVASRARLSGGASRETWSLDVIDAADRRHELVLRLGGTGDALADQIGGRAGGGPAGEAALLRDARRAGVPVPGVVAATDTYLIMTRVEGETIPRRILRDDLYREARPRLAAQCGQALAAIHRMPVPAGAVADPLRRWRDVLDLTGQPHPVFELAFRRLAGTRPAATGRVLVHGDFRNGNLIVGPEGVRAVLDWELAHAGDPLEDLGWLCVKAWRFGAAPPVGGFGHYDDLVGAYEKAGGHPVDRDALRWWETFGVLKWGVICVMQAMRHLRGGERSVELAAIGRRVCENEWDLLDMLD
ncbi:phosphotransferase family protein [Nonomuraea sp. SBT364]|uniref:phosphotransferase family protein n=1 Tax=Nonomuraea sp. SBT364 TaxID=1580530 RepID=UPI00066C3B4A|nr:phosphotransferase family protein [Nonomuraea sp. SBT364]